MIQRIGHHVTGCLPDGWFSIDLRDFRFSNCAVHYAPQIFIKEVLKVGLAELNRNALDTIRLTADFRKDYSHIFHGFFDEVIDVSLWIENRPKVRLYMTKQLAGGKNGTHKVHRRRSESSL
jgi:hypothetical protein